MKKIDKDLNFLKLSAVYSLHLKILEKYISILKSHDFFKSGVIVGSFAKKCSDRLSDLDIILFVNSDKVNEAFEEIRNKQFFPVLHRFEANEKNGNTYEKTIYDNFISVEIHIFGENSQFKLKNPYINFFGSHKVVEKFLSNPIQAEIPSKSIDINLHLGWTIYGLLKTWIRGDENNTIVNFIKVSDMLKNNQDLSEVKSKIT